MVQISVLDQQPTGHELLALRAAVGWSHRDPEDNQKGLDGTLYAVCAYDGDTLVGSARVVGDGRTVFYIQDVIVLPSHQGMGIGRALMERVMVYIEKNACQGAVVGLMAAVGKEPFYQKFGFRVRPNEREGAGMIQFWKL